MPKIPLYNQGAGPTVGVAAGQLSPRASAAAFTAPGKAAMGYQKVFSDIGNVAAEFELGRQGVEADTLDSQISTEIDRGLSELNRERLDNPTEFRRRAEEVYTNATAGIDSANINSKLKQGLKSKIGNRFRVLSLSGEQQAFTQGQQNSATQFSDFYTTLKSQLRADPSLYEELKGDLSIKVDSMVESGVIQYLEQTPQQILAEFDQENSVVTISQMGSVAQIDAFMEEEANKPLTQSQLNIRLNVANDRKSTLASEALEGGRTFLQTGDFSPEEFDDLEDAILNKEVITDNNENTFDLSNVSRSSIGTLISDLQDNVSGIENLQNDNALASIKNAEDPTEYMDSLFKVDPSTGRNMFGHTPEESEGIILSYAEDVTDEISDLLKAGVVPEDAEETLQQVAEILGKKFNGRESLIDKEDNADAKTLRGKVFSAIGDINKVRQKQVTLQSGVNAFENGNGDIWGLSVKPEEFKEVVNQREKKHLENNDIPSLISEFGKNNAVSPFLKATLEAGALEGASPDYDPSALDQDDVKNGYALYKQMKVQAPALLDKHLSSSDETIRFYKTLETLEPANGLEKSIRMVQRMRGEEVVNLSYKSVQKEVENMVEGTATYSWYKYLPFTTDEPDFYIADSTFVAQDIKELTKTYIRVGLDADDALKAATEHYGKTHQLVRNIMVQKTQGLPEDIAELADTAVAETIKKNPEILERYDEKDLSIRPYPEGQNRRWIIVSGGGGAVITSSNEDYIYEVGEPYQQDIVGLDFVIPAGSYPPNSLRGLVATEEASARRQALRLAVGDRNIELDKANKTGAFEGVTSRRELNRIEADEKDKLRFKSKQLTQEKISELMQNIFIKQPEDATPTGFMQRQEEALEASSLAEGALGTEIEEDKVVTPSGQMKRNR